MHFANADAQSAAATSATSAAAAQNQPTRTLTRIRQVVVSFSTGGPDREVLKLRVPSASACSNSPPETSISQELVTAGDVYSFVKSHVATLLPFHLEVYNAEKQAYEPIPRPRLLADDDEEDLTPFPASYSRAGRMVLVVIESSEEGEEGELELLAIEGRAFPQLTHNEMPFMNSKLVISTTAGEHTAADGATGMNTWDAAVVLASYLETHPEIVRGKTVLELGSGTGLGGMAAAALGAKKTLLTDLEYTLSNIQANIDSNMSVITGMDISVAMVDWFRPETYRIFSNSEAEMGEPEEREGEGEGEGEEGREKLNWDVILAADVVWLEHLVKPLLQAIDAMSGQQSVLLISHQHRSTLCDRLLFDGLATMFNCVTTEKSEHGVFQSHKIDVYRCIRLGT